MGQNDTNHKKGFGRSGGIHPRADYMYIKTFKKAIILILDCLRIQ
jgi:hypothetical protein